VFLSMHTIKMDPKQHVRACNKAIRDIKRFLSDLETPVLLLDNVNIDTTLESSEQLHISAEDKERLSSLILTWYAVCSFYKDDTTSPRTGRVEPRDLAGKIKKTKRYRSRRLRKKTKGRR
jgi:hypothetical protein